MIELDRHIEILLLSNDCVIVPDFGGFMAHHVDARYDEEECLFLPPLRTLGFNPQLTLNDHLLVQSYIETYDISYPEAQRRIEDEVSELKQHIESEGEFELNGIGTLRLNEEGRYVFEPCEAGILTPALYGLSSFEMPLLTNERKTASILPTSVAGLEDAAQEEEIIDEEDTPAQSRQHEDAIVIKMTWIRNAAAVAAAIVAFFLLSTPVGNSDMTTDIQQSSILPMTTAENGGSAKSAEKPQESIMPQQPQENATGTDAAAQEATAEPQQETAEPAQEENAAGTAQPAPQPAKDSYTIVLASQTTRKHAQDFIGRLEKSGYKEARLAEMSNSSKVRVVFGNYSTEQDAQTQLRSLRAADKTFQEAWVLHQ